MCQSLAARLQWFSDALTQKEAEIVMESTDRPRPMTQQRSAIANREPRSPSGWRSTPPGVWSSCAGDSPTAAPRMRYTEADATPEATCAHLVIPGGLSLLLHVKCAAS